MLFVFCVRRTRTFVPVLFTLLLLRIAARIVAFMSHFFCYRRSAAPSVNVRRLPGTIARNQVVLCSLLANTTRSVLIARIRSLKSRRLPSTPLGGGVWSVPLGTLHGTCSRASHILSSSLVALIVLFIKYFPRESASNKIYIIYGS